MHIFKEDAGFISPTSTGEEMFVDVGIYGVPGAKKFKAVESTRAVEDFVRSVQGFQMLYADMYHTREEFRQMFHHETYDRVRQALHADKAFPEVYDKVRLGRLYCPSASISAGVQGQPPLGISPSLRISLLRNRTDKPSA
jgi:hypothetical protein